MRHDLNYGGGWVTAFVDIRSGFSKIYSAETAEAVHAEYGGEQYYISRSGASGAGWIEGGLHIRPAGVYRTDTRRLALGPRRAETLPGVEVLVPFTWSGEAPALDGELYPVVSVVTTDDGGVVHVLDGCPHLSADGLAPAEEVTLEWLAPCGGGAVVQKGATWRVASKYSVRYSRRIGRRLIEALYHEDMSAYSDMTEAEAAEMGRASRWWTFLGLYPVGNWVWKVTNDIIRSATPRAELTLERLQELAPANVLFLSPEFYVQERKDTGRTEFIAAARTDIDGEEYEFEVLLTVAQFVAATRGNFADVLEEALAGCREKAERDAENRRNRLWEQRFRDRFGELVETHGDLKVTIADSVAAGNCEVGSREWGKEHFPGQSCATLRELARFKTDPGVWRVLRHVLRAHAEE